MSTKLHWGSPLTTSGWQNYPNGFVYSNGIQLPLTRLGYYGSRPIRVHTFGDYYVTGPGSFMRMNYGGNWVDAGNIGFFANSGGLFQWEAHQSGSSYQMFFGRDPGCCQVISANDGFVWAGLLAGSLYWDQVPAVPSLNPIVSGNDIALHINQGDDGGTVVQSHSYQTRYNGGPWSAQVDGVANGVINFNDHPPGTYEFRAWSWNAVGPSQTNQTAPVSIRSAGGKRLSGATYVPFTISRRLTSTGWKDIVTAKRLTASGWVDLTS